MFRSVSSKILDLSAKSFLRAQIEKLLYDNFTTLVQTIEFNNNNNSFK